MESGVAVGEAMAVARRAAEAAEEAGHVAARAVRMEEPPTKADAAPPTEVAAWVVEATAREG